MLNAIARPWDQLAVPVFRRLAQVIEPEPGQDVLWVGTGLGRGVLWWADRYRTHTVGVNPDAAAVERAESSAARMGLGNLVTLQAAPGDALPHEARTFDVVIVDFLSLPGADAAQVVAEAARVARPMATVAGLVFSWLNRASSPDARAMNALGLEPRLVMEWKALFRDAGIVELTAEDATIDGHWMVPSVLGGVAHGWRAAGWRGVRAAMSPDIRRLRALAARRALGLSIIKGTRWPHR
jgi:SAM-dependent methyltransferase